MGVNEILAIIFCIVLFIMGQKLDRALKSSYGNDNNTLKENK